uniref:ATP-binding protein n=1 Tax=Ningiella ruwaisensis TaxID=2364274 RepID=UPI0014473A9A|nr:ATP-binding protein [Ningiella ruwaisensis]
MQHNFIKLRLLPKIMLPFALLLALLTHSTASILLNIFAQKQMEAAQSSIKQSASQVAMLFDKDTNEEDLSRIVTIVALADNVERALIVEPQSDSILASSQFKFTDLVISDLSANAASAYSIVKNSGWPQFSPIKNQSFAFAYPIAALRKSKISTLDFILLVEFNTYDIDKQFAEYRNKTIVISVLFFCLLVSALYALISWCVKQPLDVFKRYIKNESVKNTHTPISLNTSDEFEDIANAYNEMLVAEQKSLQAAEEAKQRAEDLATKKSQFLANMSHELRTPINGILGLAQLCERTNVKEDLHRYLNQLTHSSNLLLSVVNDILDFSRLDEDRTQLHYEKTPLSSIVRSVSNLVQVMADEKMLSFKVDVAPTCPFEVTVDQKRLQRILINLLNNAVKFTSSGSISFSLSYAWPEDLNNAKGELICRVEDTGIGISEKHLPTLFDPFEQADTSISRNYGGSGLGLAICKELVALMGGDITVHSKLAQGSCFTVRLPCKGIRLKDSLKNEGSLNKIPHLIFDEANHPRAKHFCDTLSMLSNTSNTVSLNDITQTHCKAPYVLDEVAVLEYLIQAACCKQIKSDETLDATQQAHAAKILLVEDNEINAIVAKTMLEEQRFTVLVTANGEEAVKAAKQRKFDAILMDIQMPVMDGYEATRQIRKLDKHIPIIALSANVMEEDRQRAMAAGMNDYLHKPIVREKLNLTLNKYINHFEKAN